MIVPTRSAVDAMGSSVCGSPIIARFAAPPFGGAASVGLVASATTTTAAMAAKTARADAEARRAVQVKRLDMTPPGGSDARLAAPIRTATAVRRAGVI